MTQPDDTPPPDQSFDEADIGAEACHAALTRLAALLARGQDADRLVAESATLITAWAQTLDADAMRERLSTMLDQLGDAQALAEDQGSEIAAADGAGQRRHEQHLGGLRAMYAAFARAADAMP